MTSSPSRASGGGFTVAEEPIAVPTLFVGGADDGCARPFLTEGQDALFTAGYRAETWLGTGHFPHLERPERTAAAVLDWFAGSVGRASTDSTPVGAAPETGERL